MDGHELAKNVAPADYEARLLALEFQILRDLTDGGKWIDSGVVADLGVFADDGRRADGAVGADGHVRANHDVRPDAGTRPNARPGVHDGGGVDVRRVGHETQ